MAYTTIDDPSQYFQIALYTGNGGTQNITNDGNSDLQPDWVWVKDRTDANDHKITDSSRLSSGNPTLTLESNTTIAEFNDTDSTTAYLTDGFSLGANGNLNTNTNSYVAWQWKANGGTTTTNDASATGIGNQDSVHQANTTSKFSIFTYGPLGSGGQIAHGLGTVPHVIIIKSRSGSRNWCIYHHKNTTAPETDFLSFDQNVATQDATVWNDTVPTSTVVSVSGDGKVGTDETYVGYAFAEVKGYSKFGSYTGNGNSDGTFVYTGFKPAWVMTKRTDSSDHWRIVDATREPFNDGSMQGLKANTNEAEADAGSRGLDFLSNGFKIRTTDPDSNASGGDYIYMAFAEHPFVSSEGVPTTAR